MTAPERISIRRHRLAAAFLAQDDQWTDAREYLRADTAIPLADPALIEVREALYSCLGALKAAGVQFWPEQEVRAALAKLDALMMLKATGEADGPA